MAFIVPVPVYGGRTSVRYMDNYPSPYYYGSPMYGRRRYHGYYPGTVYTYNTRYNEPILVTRSNNSVMLGPLPSDFLTVPSNPATQRLQQEENDHAMAAQLQMMNRSQQVVGRLQVTVVRACLNKNYGMTRMDPYTRLHFGQQVFETQTDPNGAKNPVWNKTFYIYQLPKNFNSFHIEVYDERSLTDDERVAWATITLPQNITQGVPSDQWYKLSGKIGDNLEGSIHIIMSYETGPAASPPMVLYGGSGYPVVGNQYIAPPLPVYQVPQPPPTPAVTDEDVKQVSLMFPSMEEAAVRSVLEASNNNKEVAVEALLSMQQAS